MSFSSRSGDAIQSEKQLDEFFGYIVSSNGLDDQYVLKAVNDGNRFSWESCCFATCCPCIILGHMKSKTKREGYMQWTINKWFGGYHMGRAGCETCCHVCVLASICWPASPCLAWNIFSQRRRYQIIYNVTLNQTSSFCVDTGLPCLMWPCSLLQINEYLRQQDNDQLLKFDWELEIIEDVLQPSPPSVSKKIVIVGPPQCGKTIFTQKLVGATMTDMKTISESQTEHVAKIQVGVKCCSISRHSVTFLEAWDVPFECVGTRQQQLAVQNSGAIAFLFECSSDVRSSFDATKALYDTLLPQITDLKIFCIAAKMDLLTASKLEEEDSQSLGGTASVAALGSISDGSLSQSLRRQALASASQALEARRGVLAEARLWATSVNATFLEVSSVQNMGVRAAFYAISEGTPVSSDVPSSQLAPTSGVTHLDG